MGTAAVSCGHRHPLPAMSLDALSTPTPCSALSALPCCAPASSLPRARGADAMPVFASVFGVHVFMMLKNWVCAGAGGWLQVLNTSWNPAVQRRDGGETWLFTMLAGYIRDAASCRASVRTTESRYRRCRYEAQAPSFSTSYVFRRTIYPHSLATHYWQPQLAPAACCRSRRAAV